MSLCERRWRVAVLALGVAACSMTVASLGGQLTSHLQLHCIALSLHWTDLM